MRQGRDAWILGVLLIFFILVTAWFTQQGFQNQQREQPTTYSIGKGGIKALYQLLARVGVQVRRQEQPLTKIPADTGLLVMSEPFARPITTEEQIALRDWVEGGGTLLLVLSGAWSPLRPTMGVKLPGIKVLSSNLRDATQVTPETDGNRPRAYLKDVQQLRINSGTRLFFDDGKIDDKNKKGDAKKSPKRSSGEAESEEDEEDMPAPEDVETLVQDALGACVMVITRGEGQEILVSDGLSADNGSIAGANNAIFYVNAAQAQTKGSRPVVLFDEYHQGFGYEVATGKSLWQMVGASTRAAFWYLLAAFALLLYNLNRRFGTALRMDGPTSRPSTEYIASMAGFYRRARAGDIALETIYHNFVRDLAIRVDAPPESSPQRIAELAGKRLGWNAEDLRALRTLMERCEAIQRTGEATANQPRAAASVQETELLRLAQQIQDYRRKAELVRLSYSAR